MNDSLMRMAMVESQLIPRGIRDERVLAVMNEVPRHLFVPPSIRAHAYEDRPLPIGEGQTISQPYIVALMAELAQLKPHERVLEIGSGSGYAAAVVAHLCEEVFSIERIEHLAQQAKNALEEAGVANVHLQVGDGSLGWQEKAPYDVILVTAGAPVLPKALKKQISKGGRIIIPIGDAMGQRLVRLQKQPTGELVEEIVEYVRFVPLIGKEGW